MQSLCEHGFDPRSPAEPHLQVHERGVLRLEATKRLGGGGDLVGLRSEPAFVGRSSDSKRTVQLWHGGTSRNDRNAEVSARPVPVPMCGQTPEDEPGLATASWP